MKQKLSIPLALVLFFIFPQTILANGTDSGTSTAAGMPVSGMTTPTFLFIILGGSLFLAGLLVFRRLSYNPNQ